MSNHPRNSPRGSKKLRKRKKGFGGRNGPENGANWAIAALEMGPWVRGGPRNGAKGGRWPENGAENTISTKTICRDMKAPAIDSELALYTTKLYSKLQWCKYFWSCGEGTG